MLLGAVHRQALVTMRGLIPMARLRAFFICAALLALVGLVAPSTIGYAKDNNGYGGGYGSYYDRDAQRRQQQEMMERQRKEQERQRQLQQQQQQQAQQRQQQQQRQPSWQQPNQKQPVQNQKQQGQQQQAVAKRQGDDKDAEKDAEDDADNGSADLTGNDADGAQDFSLNEAAHRVREIERERQRELSRAQRQSDEVRRREQARDERIRERTLRRHEEEARKQASKPPPDVVSKLPAPAEERAGPAVAARLPVALSDDAEGRPPATTADLNSSRDERRVEPPTSHLGRGDTAKEDDGGVVANDAPSARDGASPGDAVPATADTSAKSAAAPRNAPFVGKAKGAEMPASLFAQEKKGELLVNDLSDADVAAARARGLIVSEPTELKGAGTKTFRLSAPGLTAQEVERDMHRTLALHDVQLNFAYTIFLSNVGLTDQFVDRATSVASTEPCPNNTCFGGTLIKWTPALNACARGVRVGIVDTSFDTGHPAFKRRAFIGREFLNGEGASPFDWHGTAILSLLAGDPASSTPGLISDATFLLAAAFRSDINGNASTDTLRLLAALDWLDSENVDIVNMSFSGPQDPALAKAIERMSSKGVVFVAAAGNMGPTAGPSYPAAYPHVIAVTAVNRNEQNYRQANRGPYIDLSAPGVDILTALPNARQGYRTGTSFAVPFVTAIAATNVKGQDAVAKDDLVRRITTRDLGPPGPDEIYGAGLVLAPATCTGAGSAVAEGGSGSGSWATTTTFVKADTGFGP